MNDYLSLANYTTFRVTLAIWFRKAWDFSYIYEPLLNFTNSVVNKGVFQRVKDFFEKTKDAFIRSTDQNDDGKFNKKDISAIADNTA